MYFNERYNEDPVCNSRAVRDVCVQNLLEEALRPITPTTYVNTKPSETHRDEVDFYRRIWVVSTEDVVHRVKEAV